MSFRRIFPEKGRILFDGGKNNQYDKQLIEDNQSPDCANVIFDNGSVATREGFQKLNTLSVGSFAGDGLYTRRDDTGAETMVAFAGGLMYTLNTTTFVTVPSAQSVFTAGSPIFAEMQENYLFICNGNHLPYKWNGAEFTRHGVYPPTATSTASTGGAGVLTGDYRYKVAAVNSAAVESDVGPATATWTAASQAATLTGLPIFAASFGVNARHIYRTASGGLVFKFLTAINDNTTTTFSDNIPDVSLGSNAPTDAGVPPNYTAIKYHQNRLFFLDPANPNYLWFTDLGNPYTVSSTNFIKLGDNTSDLAKALGIWQNNIVVFCERSIFLIYMPSADESGWQTVRTQSPYGSSSAKTILNIDGDLFFPALQNNNIMGFSLLKGVSIAQNTTFLTNNAVSSDRISDPIYPDVLQMLKLGAPFMTGITFQNKAWISMRYGVGSTTNNRVYQIDYRQQLASKKERFSWVPFTGFAANDFTIYNGSLYFISSAADGFVFKAESGIYNDNGAAIDSYYWTKEFQGIGGEWNFTKDFRFAKFLIGKLGDWFMNIKFRSDSDKGDGDTQQVSLDAGGTNWGALTWGLSTWGGGVNEENIKVFLRGKRGDRIQFRFDNQNKVGQAFKVVNGDFTYNLKGYR